MHSREATPNLFCIPSEKGSTLKGKKLLLGNKCFPLRVDLFSEGDWCAGKQTRSLKNCLPCKSVYSVPLKAFFSFFMKGCLDTINLDFCEN